MARPAQSAEPARQFYTYADLDAFPEDKVRRELLDGVLLVNPSPVVRHEDVVSNLHYLLRTYAEEAGGKAYGSNVEVRLPPGSAVVPDVIFVRSDHLDRLSFQRMEAAPDLVVEVSSPSTRLRDLSVKRDLYERHQIPCYWFVDLEARQVLVFEMGDKGYGDPLVMVSGDFLEPAGLEGLSVPVTEVFKA